VTPLCTDAVQCDFHNLSFIENAEWEFLTWRKDFPDELGSMLRTEVFDRRRVLVVIIRA